MAFALASVACSPPATTHDAATDGNRSDAIGGDGTGCSGGFVCADGACLSMDQVCDGVQQCADGSDESAAAGCQSRCMGCVSNGTCVGGTDPAACGRNGGACSACAAGESCAQGECIVPPSCNPSNCPSGCCNGDQCMPGTTNAACGANGFMCATCASGESCTNGVCRAPCSPTTCAGCCQPDGTCADGASDSAACGRGGMACTSCGSGTTCAGGACASNACLATCTGCCGPDGYCWSGIDAYDDNSHCGHGGGACAACSTADRCAGGACVPVTAWDACQSGCLDASNVCQPGTSASACGTGGARCAACTGVLTCRPTQHCNIDPDSLWDFIVLNGSVPSMNGTSAWDPFGGLPDPRIRVEAHSVGYAPNGGVSATQNNTLSPNWGGAVAASGIAYREMTYSATLSMEDDDGVYDDFVTACGFRADYREAASLQSIFGGEIQTCRDAMNGAWFRWQVVPHH